MDLLTIPLASSPKPLKNLAPAKKSRFSSPKQDIFLTPRIKKSFFPYVNLSTEHYDETLQKPLIFRKIKSRNSRKSISLSPINKISEKAIINDKFDYSKMKKIKETSQKSELQLEHLYNQMRETVNKKDEETIMTEKLRICFEMIDAVFL